MIARTLTLIALIVSLPATASASKRTSAKKLDIASLTVDVPTGGLCAGRPADLVIAATLADGSVLRTPDALRPRDFELAADLGEVSDQEALLVENTGLELAGRSVTVTVSAKATGASGRATFPLGFGCAVAIDYTGDGDPGTSWMPPRAERDLAEIEAYQAETGNTGPRLSDLARAALPVGYALDAVKNAKPALAGEKGADGADGGTGGNGAKGGTGGPGQPGAPGHSLTVDVGPAPGSALVVVTMTPKDGAPARSVLLDPANGGTLTVVTRGGTGGRGGKGGTGGSGGAGAWEINEGRGGNGAGGGTGGVGGPGGRGGDVTIRYDSAMPALAQVVTVDAAGGLGGRGGDGGEFGASGPGAEGAASGSMGSTESTSGANGPDGAAGAVKTTPVAGSVLFSNQG